MVLDSMFSNSLITRRNALKIALASATGMGVKKVWDNLDSEDVFAQEYFGLNSLKQRAAAKGLIYGAAIPKDYLAIDKKLADSFVRNCGILASDTDLKWDALRPTPDKFDFSKGDWLLRFAKKQNIPFRGHTLVWYQAFPKWFEGVLNRNNAEKLMTEHIATVTKHYAGQMHSWDVVNEAIEPYHRRSDGLRETSWFKFLGPDYIELAFRIAAENDPKALLVYNEASLVYDLRSQEMRRDFTLKLLDKLKSKGTPIHALGIQSHLTGHLNILDAKKLRDFLADVASLGLKIMITELDVNDFELPFDIATRDSLVASKLEEFLSVILEERAVTTVITWGLSDRYTWYSRYKRADSAPVRPLPLDSDFKPKLAWDAIAKAFDNAPKR